MSHHVPSANFVPPCGLVKHPSKAADDPRGRERSVAQSTAGCGAHPEDGPFSMAMWDYQWDPEGNNQENPTGVSNFNIKTPGVCNIFNIIQLYYFQLGHKKETLVLDAMTHCPCGHAWSMMPGTNVARAKSLRRQPRHSSGSSRRWWLVITPQYIYGCYFFLYKMPGVNPLHKTFLCYGFVGV